MQSQVAAAILPIFPIRAGFSQEDYDFVSSKNIIGRVPLLKMLLFTRINHVIRGIPPIISLAPLKWTLIMECFEDGMLSQDSNLVTTQKKPQVHFNETRGSLTS